MNDGKVLVYGGERNGVRALMKQSLNGGLTEEPLNFDTEELFDFGYSADGRLAVTRGGWQHDIVLISGLNQY